MRLLVSFVRSMGIRRGVSAWWFAVGLRAEARMRLRTLDRTAVIHHGERPRMPGWRR